MAVWFDLPKNSDLCHLLISLKFNSVSSFTQGEVFQWPPILWTFVPTSSPSPYVPAHPFLSLAHTLAASPSLTGFCILLHWPDSVSHSSSWQTFLLEISYALRTFLSNPLMSLCWNTELCGSIVLFWATSLICYFLLSSNFLKHELLPLA